MLPFDLVIIGEIPQHYYADPDFETLKEYGGKYGLITYHAGEPFYYGRKEHPGWTSGDGSHIYVESKRVCDDSICSSGFWLPAITVQKIPFNSLIMNIFSEFVWQMADDEGPSCHFFVVRGMKQFALIERILNTSYEELVKAHNAAMAILDGSRSV